VHSSLSQQQQQQQQQLQASYAQAYSLSMPASSLLSPVKLLHTQLPCSVALLHTTHFPAAGGLQGNMPSWMSLLVQALEEPAAAAAADAADAASGAAPGGSSSSSSFSPVHVFLFKAILHVEMRARDARQRQLQQQQADDAAGRQAESGSGSTSGAGSSPVDVYVSNTLFEQFAEQLFPGLVAALLPVQTAAAAGNPAGTAAGGGPGGSFHYVLRDFVMVMLMWPRLFERTTGVIHLLLVTCGIAEFLFGSLRMRVGLLCALCMPRCTQLLLYTCCASHSFTASASAIAAYAGVQMAALCCMQT
jgi:hypothetical protein